MENEYSKQIKNLLKKIEEICLNCPELRFGQILQILLSENDKGLYDVENHEWIDSMKKIAEKEMCVDYSGYIH